MFLGGAYALLNDHFVRVDLFFERMPEKVRAIIELTVATALFAAIVGVSGTAMAAMGVIALPAMLNRGYPKGMAPGSIAAGGSRGILIPPSVTMIVYGLIASTSIGRLYAARCCRGCSWSVSSRAAPSVSDPPLPSPRPAIPGTRSWRA